MNPETKPATARRRNPFSSTAIAHVSETSEDTFTVDTSAIKAVYAVISRYLSTDYDAANGKGNVIAIVGDYGTGKTHLAHALLRKTRRASDSTIGMYIDSPPGNFLRLYRESFVTKLDRAEVRARVREYYADIVADSLEASELTRGIAQPVREMRVDANEVVEEFGLIEDQLIERARAKLKDVTETDDFGAVLTLFLRPGFDRIVWDWLSGHALDPVLHERGISTAIDTEALALEAIGVFALLFGSKRHRFVLVIDELEKVLSATRPIGDDAGAFQKLLSVFSRSGAFLVLSGLPDFTDALPKSVRERIGQVIPTPPLDAGQTAELISGLQEQANGQRTIEPFTPEIITYLVRVSGGGVRKILRLCHHAYSQAVDEGTEVTVRMIERAARDHYGLGSIDDIDAQLRQFLLAEMSLPFRRNLILGDNESSRADYWISVGDLGAGCAIVIAEPVLSQEEADLLRERSQAIRNASPRSEQILIIDGFLADYLSLSLEESFHSTPLIYENTPGFRDDLGLTIREAVKRLELEAHDDAMEFVRGHVDRISRQQAVSQDYIERLAAYVDDWRTSTNRQLSALNRCLQDLPGTMDGGASIAVAGSGLRAQRLPGEVGEHFERALTAVYDVTRLDSQFADAFAERQSAATGGPSIHAELADRLRSTDVIEATGITSLLRKLLEEFQDGVARWLSTIVASGLRHPPADEERLRSLCETYDSLFDNLPAYRLDALVDRARTSGGREDPIVASTRKSHRVDLQDALDDLGGRIYRAALDWADPEA